MTRTRAVHAAAILLMVALAVAMVARDGGVSILAGAAAGDGPDRTILLHFRLPRLVLAMLTGAALGLAGSPMQVMLGNPLASPDIIGFGAGAAAGAVAAIVIGGSVSFAGLGAIPGGLAAAALVLGLAWRNGIAPLALVLIGVGISLMLGTLVDLMLSLGSGIQATDTARFLTGSFSAASWSSVAAMAAVTAAVAVWLARLSFAVDRLELGDDLATALGLDPDRIRLATAACAAILVAASVTVAGPIGFVAFLAGPLARLAVGRPGCVLKLAALTGAVIALGADALSQVVIAGTRLPAGVYTTVIGGGAMILLLLRGDRERR